MRWFRITPNVATWHAGEWLPTQWWLPKCHVENGGWDTCLKVASAGKQRCLHRLHVQGQPKWQKVLKEWPFTHFRRGKRQLSTPKHVVMILIWSGVRGHCRQQLSRPVTHDVIPYLMRRERLKPQTGASKGSSDTLQRQISLKSSSKYFVLPVTVVDK